MLELSCSEIDFGGVCAVNVDPTPFTEATLKRGTPRHWKTKRLARTLKIELYAAVGLLEMLWHFAGEFTPCGDIGRVTDAEIAEGVAWRKNAPALVAAFIDAGWIERSDKHRLIIHDWDQHADDAVKKKLSRMGAVFLPEYRLRRDGIATECGHGPPMGATPSASREAGLGKASGNGRERQGSEVETYWRFLESWPEDRRGVDLGAQVWISLIERGEISDNNMPEIFAGLERWKASELWNRDGGKYIPAIANPEGKGWLQKRAWRDHPKQFVKEANW